MSHRVAIAALYSFGIMLAACKGDPAAPSEGIPEASLSQTGSVPATFVGIWRQQPSIVPARRWAAATVSGKSVVVIGGEINGVSTRRVDAYNVETRTWTRLAPLPEGRFWHDATTINGKIYVAGGENVAIIDGVSAGTPTKTLFVYDPATNTWSRKADVPTRVQIVHQAGLLGRLYVYTDNDHFWRYNPKLDKWTSLPLPPSQHGDGIMRAVGDKIYLTGGRKLTDAGWEYNPELDVYDPATRTWTVKSPLPAAYNDLGHRAVAVSFHGKLWVAGGASDNTRPAGDLYAYDPLTDRWAAGPPMLRTTMNAAAAWAGGKFFVFGGNNSIDLTQPSSFVEALTTSY
jgi:N-acetylneuraminic acid mutarotase